jgi:deazaflavin-dependent oxidoreductase (nitroreductase family)
MSAYQQPDWFTRTIFNPAVAALTRAGLSLFGSRVLRVRGRSSGEWRETPVNLLVLGGEQYLVAPRGETQWVRNIRVAGGGELRVGRRVEAFTVREVEVADRPPMIRAYLERWNWQVKAFFGGVGPTSPDGELAAECAAHPVFRLTAGERG